MSPRTNRCDICDRDFSTQSNLIKHFRNIHPDESSRLISKQRKVTHAEECSTYTFRCLEGCELAYKKCSDLRHHLQDVHKILHDFEELNFTTKEEYTSWLKEIAEKSTAQYVHNAGVRRTETTEKIYLQCSRSGKSRSLEGDRCRKLKRQGSSKINSSCTSQIFATNNLLSGTYQVKFYKQHYAHNMEIQHLRLTKEEKVNIAAKLMQGVSSDRILDAVRGNTSEDVKRLDLITRKDINNIRRAYNINVVDCRKYKLHATPTQATSSNDNKKISALISNLAVNIKNNVERAEYISKIKEHSAILLHKIENEHSIEVLSHVLETIKAASDTVDTFKGQNNYLKEI